MTDPETLKDETTWHCLGNIPNASAELSLGNSDASLTQGKMSSFIQGRLVFAQAVDPYM